MRPRRLRFQRELDGGFLLFVRLVLLFFRRLPRELPFGALE